MTSTRVTHRWRPSAHSSRRRGAGVRRRSGCSGARGRSWLRRRRDQWFRSPGWCRKRRNSSVAVTCARLQKSDQAEFRATLRSGSRPRHHVDGHGHGGCGSRMGTQGTEGLPFRARHLAASSGQRRRADHADPRSDSRPRSARGTFPRRLSWRVGPRRAVGRTQKKTAGDGVVTLGTPFLGTPVAVAPETWASWGCVR